MSHRGDSLIVMGLLVIGGLGGCMFERVGRERIVDPALPAPTFCRGNPTPCGERGYRGVNHDLIITARPRDSTSEDDVEIVWQVEFVSGRSPGFHYGILPRGAREIVPAQPLAPGFTYEFEGLYFVVRGDRIRRVPAP